MDVKKITNNIIEGKEIRQSLLNEENKYSGYKPETALRRAKKKFEPYDVIVSDLKNGKYGFYFTIEVKPDAKKLPNQFEFISIANSIGWTPGLRDKNSKTFDVMYQDERDWKEGI